MVVLTMFANIDLLSNNVINCNKENVFYKQHDRIVQMSKGQNRYDHTVKGYRKYELACRCQKARFHIANTAEGIRCANS